MTDLDFTPDAELAQRIRDGLPKPALPKRELDVFGWVVIDRATGEWVMRCETRQQARDLVEGQNCVIAKLVRSH